MVAQVALNLDYARQAGKQVDRLQNSTQFTWALFERKFVQFWSLVHFVATQHSRETNQGVGDQKVLTRVPRLTAAQQEQWCKFFIFLPKQTHTHTHKLLPWRHSYFCCWQKKWERNQRANGEKWDHSQREHHLISLATRAQYWPTLQPPLFFFLFGGAHTQSIWQCFFLLFSGALFAACSRWPGLLCHHHRHHHYSRSSARRNQLAALHCYLASVCRERPQMGELADREGKRRLWRCPGSSISAVSASSASAAHRALSAPLIMIAFLPAAVWIIHSPYLPWIRPEDKATCCMRVCVCLCLCVVFTFSLLSLSTSHRDVMKINRNHKKEGIATRKEEEV